jgi:surfactin synthase thioesterase subunit
MSAEHGEQTTLLCVPFAGAGPSFFHPWRELAAGRWRVTSVELPGRERRILETPYRNVVEAAKNSIDDIVADLGEGTRTVLFGHSLGAVLAYELVHLLSTRDVHVERLVVSGSPGPWTQRERRATGLEDEEFLARVEEFAGFRHEALDHPEMRELILPVLQADCEMHDEHRRTGVRADLLAAGRLRRPGHRGGGPAVAGGDHGRVQLCGVPGRSHVPRRQRPRGAGRDRGGVRQRLSAMTGA